MIETNWGGTRVEAWMPPAALDICGIPDNVIENNPQNSNSYLYNAMINPLVRMDIKGALWYQGEANSGWNRDDYQCTFPSMIESWRNTWAQFTHTSHDFPFGFVQLATISKILQITLFLNYYHLFASHTREVINSYRTLSIRL